MQKIYYHEATVLNFRVLKNNIELDVSDASSGDNKHLNVKIRVKNIIQILIDEAEEESITMLAPDGEIIDCEIQETKLFVIIEWNDFSKGVSFVKSYVLLGEKTEVSIVSRSD